MRVCQIGPLTCVLLLKLIPNPIPSLDLAWWSSAVLGLGQMSVVGEIELQVLSRSGQGVLLGCVHRRWGIWTLAHEDDMSRRMRASQDPQTAFNNPPLVMSLTAKCAFSNPSKARLYSATLPNRWKTAVATSRL